jgi:hypothetical protein
LAVPAGQRRGRTRGYASAAERFEKQRRLQVLQARLVEVEVRLAEGRVSICRGGRSLARHRHHLDLAGLTEVQWRDGWDAARWFITADGEADKVWGNKTIRWHPEEGWLEVKLPAGLAQMATNRHLSVVAVDPAYTSQWGAEHWLSALRQLSSDASGHHGAALVIGRRGLGQRARRRGWCDSTRPEDRQERATNSAVRPTPDHPGLTEHHHRKPGSHQARGQPTHRAQDPTGQRAPPGPPGDPRPFGATRQRHISPADRR